MICSAEHQKFINFLNRQNQKFIFKWKFKSIINDDMYKAYIEE